MRTTVDNYRGFAIEFNSESESFTCTADEGRYIEKKSFASCKKAVDDYIKDNSTFEPFNVVTKAGIIKKIIGIRKDRRFIYEDKGEKLQISEYNENDYYLYDPIIHDQILANITSLEIQKDEIFKQIHEMRDRINTPNLVELKKIYAAHL